MNDSCVSCGGAGGSRDGWWGGRQRGRGGGQRGGTSTPQASRQHEVGGNGAFSRAPAPVPRLSPSRGLRGHPARGPAASGARGCLQRRQQTEKRWGTDEARAQSPAPRTLRERVICPLHHALVELSELAKVCGGKRDTREWHARFGTEVARARDPHQTSRQLPAHEEEGRGEHSAVPTPSLAFPGLPCLLTWNLEMLGKSPCGRRCFFMTA